MVMNISKYIVIATDDGNEITEKMIVFPSSMKHKTIAKAMVKGRFIIISAGFIDEFLKCYGESMTVNKKSRGEYDTLMLHNMLNIDDKELKFK
jgi:hypothetical protein